jgi:hypothetical protein
VKKNEEELPISMLPVEVWLKLLKISKPLVIVLEILPTIIFPELITIPVKVPVPEIVEPFPMVNVVVVTTVEAEALIIVVEAFTPD